MLLANIYTAEKTRIEFPQSAVLRRHPSPPDINFRPLIKVAQNKVVCCVPILLPFMVFNGEINTLIDCMCVLIIIIISIIIIILIILIVIVHDV